MLPPRCGASLLRLTLLLAVGAAFPACHNSGKPPLTISVLAPPERTFAEDKVHLLYEIEMRNPGPALLEPRRLLVMDGRFRRLALYEGPALQALLRRPTVPDTHTEFAFLWLTFDKGSEPGRLLNLMEYGVEGDAKDRRYAFVAANVVQAPPRVFGPPLLGDSWRAGGISNTSHHRRAVFWHPGPNPQIAQRFAIDFVQVDANEASHTGPSLFDYYCYAEEVLAVADGTVIGVMDGTPDNPPGVILPNVPIIGNGVLLDVGGGVVVAYAHLIPGSIPVTVGQFVTKGQILGEVGNSGNSTEPHLHLHVMNDHHPRDDAYFGTDGEGVPYAFDVWMLMRGREGYSGLRTAEFPLNGAVMDFGGG